MRSRGRKRVAIAIAAAVGTVILLAGAIGAAVAGPVDPADLALTKTDSPDPAARGTTLTYTIEVTNLGPDPATATVVEDKLPGGLNFLSMATTAGTCSRQGKTVTCNLGTLAMSAEETVTIRTRVTKNKGSIDNTAAVESAIADPVAANNQDTERTSIRSVAGPSCLGKAATILGTPGNDTGASALVGTAGKDVIVARGGDDEVRSGGGRDLVCAGAGSDLVRAGGRGDAVVGGGGDDLLIGRGGGDTLRGKAGRDRLRGNAGPDLLVGGLGVDRCRGGAGRDTLRSC